jgi:hypothetical protein
MVKVSTYPAISSEKTTSELELLMIHDRPSHLWLDGEHYVKSKNRRARPGKVYHFLQFNRLLRVVDVIPSDEPVTEYSVDDAEATVVVEYLYELAGEPERVEYKREYDNTGTSYEPGFEYGPNQEYTISGQVEELLRYQVETPEALSMGDQAMVPFESTERTTTREPNSNQVNGEPAKVDENQRTLGE